MPKELDPEILKMIAEKKAAMPRHVSIDHATGIIRVEYKDGKIAETKIDAASNLSPSEENGNSAKANLSFGYSSDVYVRLYREAK